MVRVGMGLAVMPYLAIDPNDPSIVVRELSPPMPPRVHFAAQRADRTQAPAADRVIELAREVFQRLEQSQTDTIGIAG